jgi:A/G-specific adenine glycosylase
MQDLTQFKKSIHRHYRIAGRHGLPWRKTRDPYAILVSEIMLQQTQVARVEGFYPKFLRRFPNFEALAKADTTSVLNAWQGLGYNRRALSLKKAAEMIVHNHGGKLPRDRAALEKLPGIGRGTSGSLMAFVFNKPEIFIETNIRRVFIHFFFPHTRKAVTDAAIERYIESTVDRRNPREWYWALMDYGAAMAAEGAANSNPNRKSAHYKKQSAFKGSDREARGKILRYLLAQKKGSSVSSVDDVKKIANIAEDRLKEILSRLNKEGFIIIRGKGFSINK